MADTSRVIVYSPQDEFLFELLPDQVFEMILTEEVNGEHSLSLTTSHVLAKGMRLLSVDATGKWREHVVTGIDSDHADGKRAIGSYYAIWSLQYDLVGVTCTAMPGTQTPVTASAALHALLANTARWVRGSVTQATTGGASMWRMSAWKALGVLVDVWGGEVEPSITVSGSVVTGRAVDLYSRQGSSTAKRRFDYGSDLASIHQKVAEDAMYVRIIPLGKGEEIEGGGIGRKIDITSVNGGVEWLENASVKNLYRVPNGSGGWEYPTGYVENPSCDTPESLKDWGVSVLEDYTTPKVTYEAGVVQFAEAGMDVQGLAIGDAVDIVDRTFGDDGGIRITGRVLKLVTNMLDPSMVDVTIGNLTDGLPDVLGELGSSIARLDSGLSATNAALYTTSQTAMTTADYLTNIIENLNAEMNAGGGYAYIVPGHGIVTYDVAVADPLIATEASNVTQIKGGTVRLANSKKPSFAGINDWNWMTLIESGHVAAPLVTSANIISGFIGSAASGNFWDLDNGTFQMASGTTIGGKAIATQDAVVAEVDVEYAKGTSSTTAPTTGWSTTAPTWESGKYIWQRTKTVNQAGTASYSNPTCIQGAKGADGSPGSPGAAGKGVSAIVEQYYLSTSSSTQSGGSWSTNQPQWVSGKYIWTRSHITWSDNTTTDTTPVLAKAVNGANETANSASTAASNAAKTATNYLAFDATNGLCVGNQTAGTLGRNILIGNSNIDIRNGTTILARFAAKLIELGRNAADAIIRLCNGKGRIRYDSASQKIAMYGEKGAMLSVGNADDSALTNYIAVSESGDAMFAVNKCFMDTLCNSNTYTQTLRANRGIYAFRNQFGVVTVYSNGTYSFPAGNQWDSAGLGTLPEGWRPVAKIMQSFQLGGGLAYIEVDTNGAVQIVRAEAGNAGGMYVSITFAAVNPNAL